MIENLERENSDLQQNINELTSKNEEQQKFIDDLNSDIVDLKISVSSFDESALSIDEMLAMIRQEIDNCVQTVESKTAERENLLNENSSLEAKISDMENAINNSDETTREIENKIAELKQDRENKNNELVTIEENITSQFKTLEILKEQNTKLEFRKTKLEPDI